MRIIEVTRLKINMARTYKKVISIIVSFFNSSNNYILDLFKKLYIGKELINIY